jgi:tetratricopeptide (TPR) repeat protein
MSGGAVLNTEGELVAIHGQGERDEDNVKTGLNLGIPINRFATVAKKMGVELEQKVAPIPQNTVPKADDYFALAAQKFRKQDYRGSLADFDRVIQLDPNLALAYYNRGTMKAKNLQDVPGGLADYNRAIQLNPNFVFAYSNRGFLKANKLQDLQGGLADYNRAIQLDPNYYANPYGWRGVLKPVIVIKLTSGTLQSISFVPNLRQSIKPFFSRYLFQSIRIVPLIWILLVLQHNIPRAVLQS